MRALKEVCVVSLAIVLCASCATLSPERRYLGKWRGTHEGQIATALFDPNNKCVLTVGDRVRAGNWTIEDEQITVTIEDTEVHGFISSEGQLVLSAQGESVTYKKVK